MDEGEEGAAAIGLISRDPSEPVARRPISAMRITSSGAIVVNEDGLVSRPAFDETSEAVGPTFSRRCHPA